MRFTPTRSLWLGKLKRKPISWTAIPNDRGPAPKPFNKVLRFNVPSPPGVKKELSKVLSVLWEPEPGFPNISMKDKRSILEKEKRDHPFYTRETARRLAFDPSKLHWSVFIPPDFHEKVKERDKVRTRVRHAFYEDLKDVGWDIEGNPLKKSAREQLSGALSLRISSEDPWLVRKLKWKELKRLSRCVLDKFLELRADTMKAHQVSWEAQSEYRERTFKNDEDASEKADKRTTRRRFGTYV